MRISVYLPLLLAVALAGATPVLSARLAPAHAVRTLTTAAAVAGGCGTWGLTLLSVTLITDTPFAHETGAVANPVPTATAIAATAMLVTTMCRAARTAWRRHRTHRSLRAICALCSTHGELAVVPDSAPSAFAVPGRPGRPGRILVSTGLLRIATATDRRVVLAHERAHLHHHHHRYRAVADLAAALNPLLRPTCAAVEYHVERWADETAASLTSRSATASSLTTIALAAASHTSSPTLAFHRHAVLQRVQALQSPPTRSTPGLSQFIAIAAVLTTLATADATMALTQLLGPAL